MSAINRYVVSISQLSCMHIVFFRCKTTMEVLHGLMSQVIKDRLFNQVHLGK